MAVSKKETAGLTGKKVTVMLPRDPQIEGEGADQEFFSVNGHNIIIQTDVPVEVDEIFAEVINNKAKARQEARAYIKKTAFKEV